MFNNFLSLGGCRSADSSARSSASRNEIFRIPFVDAQVERQTVISIAPLCFVDLIVNNVPILGNGSRKSTSRCWPNGTLLSGTHGLSVYFLKIRCKFIYF